MQASPSSEDIWGTILSPVGTVAVLWNKGHICKVHLLQKEEPLPPRPSEYPEELAQCLKELEEYFQGTRRTFSVPLRLEGTPFQQKVWKALQQIPYGETRSYQDIARAVGNLKAVRAVGGANHRNPVAIIVPCHRVIGKDGSLTGYGGGLSRKEWLLQHEKNS